MSNILETEQLRVIVGNFSERFSRTHMRINRGGTIELVISHLLAFMSITVFLNHYNRLIRTFCLAYGAAMTALFRVFAQWYRYNDPINVDEELLPLFRSAGHRLNYGS